MLDTKLRYGFIERHSENCTNEQLYKNYRHYQFTYDGGHVCSQTEHYSDLLWYLKKFISKNKPEAFIKVMSDAENLPYFKHEIELEYIYHMNMVAQIHLLFFDDYEIAVQWSKKTLDMIEYFMPTNNALDKEYCFYKDSLYKNCYDIYQKYKEFFNENKYREFIFDWEKEFYSPSFYANDNALKAL